MPPAVLFAVSIAVGAITAQKQISFGKKAAAADKRANKIAGNQESIDRTQEIRRRVRLRRIKAAEVAQRSEEGGTTGSSGEAGAFNTLASNLSFNRSAGKGQDVSSKNISLQKQIASNARLKSDVLGAKNDLFQTAIGGTDTLFNG